MEYIRSADLLFFLFGIPAAIIDYRSGRIPDILSVPLIAALLVFRIIGGEYALPALAVGLAGAPSVLRLAAGRGGIGGGDLKLSAALGLYLPGFGWIPALAVAALAGLTLCPRRGSNTVRTERRIAFAPCLVAGAAAVRIATALLPPL